MLTFLFYLLVQSARAQPCGTNLNSPSGARKGLLETYSKWNQLTPQRPGEVMIVAALMVELLREPQAMLGFKLVLSDAEIDEIGETINRTHIAFQIPIRYSRSKLGDKIIGPERIRQVVDHFYQSAITQIQCGLVSLRDYGYGESRSERDLLKEAGKVLEKILDSEEMQRKAKLYRQSFTRQRIDPGFGSLLELTIRRETSKNIALVLSGLNIDF